GKSGPGGRISARGRPGPPPASLRIPLSALCLVRCAFLRSAPLTFRCPPATARVGGPGRARYTDLHRPSKRRNPPTEPTENAPPMDPTAAETSPARARSPQDGPPVDLPPVEPPTAGFILQLFVIPAIIVAVVVVVWLLFGKLAGG